MNNPLLKDHAFDTIADYLCLSEKRVWQLLEGDYISAIMGFDNTPEYQISLCRGENYYGKEM